MERVGERFLDDLGRMTEQEAEALEVPITEQELKEAIWSFKPWKAPGLDGLPYEWYRQLFPSIKEQLLLALNSVLERERLTGTMREGVTRLLNKVKGTPSPLQLRPITLLACDYKILTKIMATRVGPLLSTILRSGQLAIHLCISPL